MRKMMDFVLSLLSIESHIICTYSGLRKNVGSVQNYECKPKR